MDLHLKRLPTAHARTRWFLLASLMLTHGCSDDPVEPSAEQTSTSLAVLLGGDQTGRAHEPLASNIVFQVLDQDETPVAGVSIHLDLEDGAGLLSDTVIVSDHEGIASVEWILSNRPGVLHMYAQAGHSRNLQAEVKAHLPFDLHLPDSLLLWPRDTISLGTMLRDPGGSPLDPSYLEWRLHGLANIVSDTLLVGLQEGVETATVSLSDWSRNVELTVGGWVRVTPRALDGGDIQEDLFLFLEREGERVDSVAYADEGGFLLKVPYPLQGVEGTLLIDVVDGNHRRFFPSERDFMTLASGEMSALLIPNTWEIQRGRWAGQAIDLSLFDAWGADVSPYPNTRAFLSRTGLKSWRERDFPIPLYFLRYDTLPDGYDRQYEITAADSARIWWLVDNMNERMGVELFRPAHIDDLPLDSMWSKHPFIPDDPGRWVEYVPKTVTFSALYGERGGNMWGGSSSCTYRVDTFWRAACEKHDIPEYEMLRGGINIPFEIAWGSIHHELLHAMGFGHTQFWCSTMSYPRLESSSESRCEADDIDQSWTDLSPWGREYGGVTPFDVAYFELWLGINEWHHEQGGVDFGIVEGYRGERTRILENDEPTASPYQRRRDGWFGPF